MNATHEIPYKQWRMELARLLNCPLGNIHTWIRRGKLPKPTLRIVNQRVKYVIVNRV